MSEKIHPVYVDGPLAGQDFPMPATCAAVYALDYGPAGPPPFADPRFDVPEVANVTYSLRRYAIFGRIVCIGTLKDWPDEPSADDLAEYLLSDAAKKAVRATVEAADVTSSPGNAPNLYEQLCDLIEDVGQQRTIPLDCPCATCTEVRQTPPERS